MNRLKMVYRPPDELLPYAGSPRVHEAGLPRLKADIEEFGFVAPVLVAGDKIVDGHARHAVALEIGLAEIPTVDVSHLSQDQIRALRLVINKSPEWASWDEAKLLAELAAIEMDMSALGFDFSQILADDFGSAFDLPSGDKNPICVMSLTLHERQVATIEEAIAMVKESGVEVESFGNPNAKGNAVYEVVRQWVEQKKSK